MPLTRRGKKRLVTLFVLIVAAIGIAAGFFLLRSVYRDRLAQEKRDSGLAAFERGDYGQAIEDLRYYYQRNQDDLDVLLAYAAAQSRVSAPNGRHLVDAIRLYEHALRISPDNVNIIAALSELYFRIGRRVETELYAMRMLEFDSEHARSLELLASARRSEGDSAGAMTYVDRLCDLAPKNFLYRALSLQLMSEAGRPGEVIIQRATEWQQAHPEAEDGRWHLLLAVAQQIAGRYDAMLGSLRAAAEMGAERDLLPTMLNMLDLTNQRALTDEVLARATKQYEKESWIHELTVRRRWEAVRYAEAQRALDFALENLDDPDSLLIRWQALLAIALEDESAARGAVAALESGEFAETAEQRIADRAWARMISARLDVDRVGWSAVLAEYEEVTSLLPTEPALHFLAGEAYLSVGEEDRAAASYRLAVELQPMWVGAGLAYADALLRTGRIPEAFDAAEDLCRRASPVIVQPWITYLRAWTEMERVGRPVVHRGRALLGSWNLVTAAETAYESSERAPGMMPVLADVYAVAGLTQKRQSLMDQALARKDLSDAHLMDLARLAMRDGVANAEALLDKADADGATVVTASIRAELRRREGEPLEGLRLIERVEPAPRDAARRDWQRIHAAYLAAIRDSRAPEAIRALLNGSDTHAVRNADFVLGLDLAWEHESIINRAIEVLAQTVGEKATRVRIAVASRTLQFHADDPQAVANATLAMDDIVRESPDSLSARTLLAGLLMVVPQPNPQEAIKHLRHVVDRYPRRLDLYPRLISLLQQVGDYTTAAQYLQALGRNRDLDETTRRAEIALLEAQGDFETAIMRLSGRIDASSDEVDQLSLATLHVRAGQIQQAEVVIRDLLAEHGSSPLTLQFVAGVRAAAGRFDEGLSLIRNSEIDGGEPVRARLLGSLYHQQGYINEAGEWLQKSVELDPTNAAGRLLLAQHYLASGQQEKARRAAVKGLEHDRDNAGLQLIYASASLVADQNTRQEAIRTFREMEGDNEPLIDTIEAFGAVVKNDGTLDSGDRALRRTRDLATKHPTYLPAVRLAFMAHANAGRTREAQEYAQAAFSRFPTSPEPPQWLIEMHMMSRRMSDALSAAREWRNRSLGSPFPADAMIARLQLMSKNPAGAVRTLEPHAARLKRDPAHYAQPYSVWLQSLLLTGQIDRAFPLVEAVKVTEQRNQLLALWFETTELVDVGAAQRLLERIEPICFDDLEGRLRVALAWAALGKRSDAANHFERAERIASETGDPLRDTRINLCLGMIADARGDHTNAANRYRQVLAAQPENIRALNNLAYLLTKHVGRHEEALNYSSKAISLDPKMPDLFDTHAVVLLGNGRTQEADHAIEQALAIHPDDAPLLMTLCRIKLAAGDRPAARQALEAAESVIQQSPYVRQSVRQDATSLRIEFDKSANAGN